MVEVAWCSYASRGLDSAIIGKIDKCGKDLTCWNQNVFSNIRKEIDKKRQLLVEEAAVMRSGSNQ